MASALAQQLQLVQQLQRVAPSTAVTRRGKPSLLFGPQAAAELDAESVYQIGCQGLAELVRLNPAFNTLREALFSRAAASLVRDQQQPEALAQLDAAIHEFCQLLTQHFMTSGATKALEYLIRNFKANEHNMQSLLMAGLAYHSTNEFVVMVKTLPLEPTRGLFSFLHPCQASGASVPRSALVARCVNDPQLITWIGDAARQLGMAKQTGDATKPQPNQTNQKAGRPTPSFLSFYAVLMCEVITEIKVVSEEHLSRLLPHISSGLDAKAAPDYRAATLMMVACLASRTTLSKDMVKALVNSMLRQHPAGQGQEGTLLRVLAHVCATQPALKSIPDKALKAFSQLPKLPQELSALKEGGVRLGPLLQLVTASLATRIKAHPEEVGPLLVQLVQAGVMEQVAERLAKQLLDQACPELPDQEPTKALLDATQDVLRALDTRHPVQTDAAVNALLAHCSAKPPKAKPVTPKGPDQDESSEEEEQEQRADTTQANSQRAAAVFSLVQAVFSHTARLPCGSDGAGMMTLAAAATAPAVGVRKMAVQHIGELLSSGNASPAATDQLNASLLTSLQDQELEVVALTLSLPCIRTLPAALLLPALSPAAITASALLFPSSPSSEAAGTGKAGKQRQRDARKVLEGALGALGAAAAALRAGGAAGADGAAGTASVAVRAELNDLVLLLALQCLLPAPATAGTSSLTTCQAALDALGTLDTHPLLIHLPQLATAVAKFAADTAAADAKTDQPPQPPSAAKAAGGKKKGKGGEPATEAVTEAQEASAGVDKKAVKAVRNAAVLAAGRSIIMAIAQAIAENLSLLTTELPRLLALSRTLGAAAAATPRADLGLLRARHLLVLAIHAALTKAIKASSKNNAAAIAVGQLSQQLLGATLSELASPAAVASGAAVDAGWRELATSCVDGAGGPQGQHASALQSQPEALHQAVLRHCLLAAIEALPDSAPAGAGARGSGGAAGAGGGGGGAMDPVQVFREVACLEPHGSYDQHLGLLLDRACPRPQQRAAFLASLYLKPGGSRSGGDTSSGGGDGASSGTGSGNGEAVEEHVADGTGTEETVAIAALRLVQAMASTSMHHVTHVATPVKSKASGGAESKVAPKAAPTATTAEVTQAVLTHVPHVIAAMCSLPRSAAGADDGASPGAAIRRAATDAAAAVAAALAGVPPATHPAAHATASLLSSSLLSPDAVAWIHADPTAAVTLLQAALSGRAASADQTLDQEDQPTKPSKVRAAKAAALAAAAAAGAGTPVTGRAGKRTSGRAAAAADGSDSGSDDDETVLGGFTEAVEQLSHVIPHLGAGGVHDLKAAEVLLRSLVPGGASTGQAQPLPRHLASLGPACLQLLGVMVPAATSRPPLSPLEQRVATLAVPAAFAPALPTTPNSEATRTTAGQLFLTLLACTPTSPSAPPSPTPAWFNSMTTVRLAALHCLSSGHLPPTLLPPPADKPTRAAAVGPSVVEVKVVQALAVGASGDASPACRQAARLAIEALPVAAAHVTPVLLAAQQQLAAAAAVTAAAAAGAAGTAEDATPSKKKKKGAAAAVATPVAVKAVEAVKVVELLPPSMLEQAVLLLELLQWKAVQGEEQVVTASQQLLAVLQPAMAPLSQPHDGAPAPLDGTGPTLDTADIDDDEDLQNNHLGASRPTTNDPTTSAASSTLAGYAAQLILQSLAASAQRLAGNQQTPTESVMDVFDLELVVRVAQSARDGLARNAALTLLSLLAGLTPQRALTHVLQVLSLVHTSTTSSSDAHSHHVAATALAAVVPPWTASGRDIRHLWEPVVASLPALPTHRRLSLLTTLLHAAKGEATALPSGLLVLLQHVETCVAARKSAQAKAKGVSEEEAQAGGDEAEWVLDLAAQLANQVPLAERLHAFAVLLTTSVEAAQGQAHSPLARLCVTFVVGQLKSKVVAGSALDHQQDESLQPGCEALMAAALDTVQRLVAVTGGPDKGRMTSSIKGVYGLFEALQAVMPPHSYLQALLHLAAQPSDRVLRRALRLFADRAALLSADLARIADHPAYHPKAKAEATQRLTQAALQILPLVKRLASELRSSAPVQGVTGSVQGSASALTHQAALSALSHVTVTCGSNYPTEIAGVVPDVLSYLGSGSGNLGHASGAVRGGALAAIAAAVRACGAQLLPQLPAVAAAVVAAGEAAAAAVAAGAAGAAADRAAGEKAGRKRGGKGRPNADAGEDGAGDEEAAGQSVGQLAAVELSAALAAVGAMVSEMGAFISPYLPAFLRLLLHPAVLSCQSAGCATSAAGIRTALPAAVPPRLLFEPLFAALPYVAEQGLLPLQALLAVVTATAQRLDPTAAAAHADAVFGFLLRALDLRGAPTKALQGLEHEAETAAVTALVALTLKLSEVRFKPLFLRLLDWASSSTNPTEKTANVPRLTALFTVSAALAEKLRSVFVPYYRHLLDLAIRHLSSSGPAASTTPGSKKRTKLTATNLGPLGPAEWILRVKIIRALHRCFLYDSIGWLDAEKVNRLLPPLVAQLVDAPPATTTPTDKTVSSAAAAVAAQCADPDLDRSVKFAERSPKGDVAGVAAVAALVQLAVAANSDVHWKPLNYQVLMATRGGSARTRVLALEVVAHMVERLREEYLVLLPETLPFLSELLEDPEVAVESRAQQVLSSLEEISGEKLDQYLKA